MVATSRRTVTPHVDLPESREAVRAQTLSTEVQQPPTRPDRYDFHHGFWQRQYATRRELRETQEAMQETQGLRGNEFGALPPEASHENT